MDRRKGQTKSEDIEFDVESLEEDTSDASSLEEFIRNRRIDQPPSMEMHRYVEKPGEPSMSSASRSRAPAPAPVNALSAALAAAVNRVQGRKEQLGATMQRHHTIQDESSHLDQDSSSQSISFSIEGEDADSFMTTGTKVNSSDSPIIDHRRSLRLESSPLSDDSLEAYVKSREIHQKASIIHPISSQSLDHAPQSILRKAPGPSSMALSFDSGLAHQKRKESMSTTLAQSKRVSFAAPSELKTSTFSSTAEATAEKIPMPVQPRLVTQPNLQSLMPQLSFASQLSSDSEDNSEGLSTIPRPVSSLSPLAAPSSVYLPSPKPSIQSDNEPRNPQSAIVSSISQQEHSTTQDISQVKSVFSSMKTIHELSSSASELDTESEAEGEEQERISGSLPAVRKKEGVDVRSGFITAASISSSSPPPRILPPPNLSAWHTQHLERTSIVSPSLDSSPISIAESIGSVEDEDELRTTSSLRSSWPGATHQARAISKTETDALRDSSSGFTLSTSSGGSLLADQGAFTGRSRALRFESTTSKPRSSEKESLSPTLKDNKSPHSNGTSSLISSYDDDFESESSSDEKKSSPIKVSKVLPAKMILQKLSHRLSPRSGNNQISIQPNDSISEESILHDNHDDIGGKESDMRVVSSPPSRLVTTSSLSQIPSSSTIVSSKPSIIRDEDLSTKKVLSTSSEGAGATLSDSSFSTAPPPYEETPKSPTRVPRYGENSRPQHLPDVSSPVAASAPHPSRVLSPAPAMISMESAGQPRNNSSPTPSQSRLAWSDIPERVAEPLKYSRHEKKTRRSSTSNASGYSRAPPCGSAYGSPGSISCDSRSREVLSPSFDRSRNERGGSKIGLPRRVWDDLHRTESEKLSHEKFTTFVVDSSDDIVEDVFDGRRNDRSKARERHRRGGVRTKERVLVVKDEAVQTESDLRPDMYSSWWRSSNPTITNAFRFPWSTPQYVMGTSSCPGPLSSGILRDPEIQELLVSNPFSVLAEDLYRQQLELMKSYLDLSRAVVATQQTQIDMIPRTTLEDTKEYIRKHRPKPMTMEEALHLVDCEDKYPI